MSAGTLHDASRAAFEVWASHPDRHGKLPIEAHANGAYKDSRTYSAYYGWQASRKAAPPVAQQVAAPPSFTTGHCKEKSKPGGCRLHNLQCGYPACDRKAAAPRPPQAEQVPITDDKKVSGS